MLRKELIGVQYLRGIAALYVVLDHVSTMAHFPKYFNAGIANDFFLAGSVGVELFFVISGFIITYVSLADYSLRPILTASSFLQKRFYRIVPFMWVCIGAYALLRLLGRGSFMALPYIRAFVLFPVGDVQPNVVWTLRHEFLFYCLFCFFLIYVRKWPLMLLWFLAPFVWSLSTDSHASFLGQLSDFVFNKVNILFGMGFMVGIAYQKGFLRFSIKTRYSFIWCLLLSGMLLLFAHLSHLGHVKLSFFLAIGSGLISVGLLVVGISVVPQKPLNQLDRFGILLGDASYSIYLTHSLVVSALLGFWSKYQPNVNLLLVLLIISLTCTFVGILVHNWVEKPLLSLSKRFIVRLSPLNTSA